MSIKEEQKVLETNWYLSSVGMKESLEVELLNGAVYKYRTRKQVAVGELVVIGRGYKTSGEMGRVKKILPLGSTKASHTALAYYSFKKNPSAEELKKNATGIVEYDSIEKIVKKTSSYKTMDPGAFAYVDSTVDSILNAITVLAYPNLITAQMRKKAEDYLAVTRTVPGFLFGSGMKDIYIWTWSVTGSGPHPLTCPQVLYTGYYPGWKEELKSLSVWKEVADLGKKALQKWSKSRIEEMEDYLPLDDGESFEIGTLRDGSYVEIRGCQMAQFEKLLNQDQKYNEFCNELIYRSALSILIRGNMANLLSAALSAQMPIIPFFDKLILYAETVEAKECLQILKESDYKNKVFKEKKPAPSKVINKKLDAEKPDWPKGFVIDASCTLKECKTKASNICIPEGVKIIDANVFSHNADLTEMFLPDSVTQIKKYAFSEDRNLSKIVFGKNITVIGQNCFMNCRSLTSVDLGETKVKTLSKDVFGGCHQLKDIRFPKMLKKIEEGALSYTGLTEVTIPETVEFLEMRYFGLLEPLHLYFEDPDCIEVHLDYSSNLGKMFFHCKKGSLLWKKISEENEKIQSYNENHPKYPSPLYNLIEYECTKERDFDIVS